METKVNGRLATFWPRVSCHGLLQFLSNGSLRWMERACWIVGGSALSWCLLVYAEMFSFQATGFQQFEAMRKTDAATPAVAPSGSLVAKIRIPGIGLSAVVVSGDDERILSRAVGHIPGTASPDGIGTVGIAGHRDTFFRGLGRLRMNDEIFLETPSTTYRYQVAQTAVVEPSDIGVLGPHEYPSLVLVTCYPFSFVGHAPQRFIVTARRAENE